MYVHINMTTCPFSLDPVIGILRASTIPVIRGFMSTLLEPWEQGWHTVNNALLTKMLNHSRD